MSYQGQKLAYANRELANAQAMVRRAQKIIEDLLPGIGYTTVNVGELNDWLLASRDYNITPPEERHVDKT